MADKLVDRMLPVYTAMATRLEDLRAADRAYPNDPCIVHVAMMRDPSKTLVYAMPYKQYAPMLQGIKKQGELERIMQYKRQKPQKHYAVVATYLEEEREPVMLSGRYADIAA